MSSIEQIQKTNTDLLLGKRGVEGTAIGEKWRDGKPTGEQAILVFVQKKHTEQAINSRSVLKAFTTQDLIPHQIDGIPTDVIEVGHITKQAELVAKVRPIRPGYSCGHGSISAGTIGGVFLDKMNRTVILSNNHVLANENKAKVGEMIYQPGPKDMPLDNNNIIGRLTKFVRIKNRGNVQDSAIARISPTLITSNGLTDVYPHINQRLRGFANVTVGQSVQKCGRTTGYTTGRVLGTNASFSIGYDFGTARFDQCIVLSAMSKGGDSGSIIQDMSGNAVGLLFAGSDKVTIANPIGLVQATYGLQLYSNIASSQKLNDHWKVIKSNGAIVNIGDNKIDITANRNHYCCLETPIQEFTEISCDVNTGSDTGMAWGPGLSVHWPQGFIKLNLRFGSTFGGYTHLDHNLDAGKVKPNTTYTLRIKLSDHRYLGEIKDGDTWVKILEVPQTLFNSSPIMVRIGKTDKSANYKEHSMLGPSGHCSVSNFNMF